MIGIRPLVKGFVLTVRIELLPEAVALVLLCREIGRRRARGLGLESTVHPLMTTNRPFLWQAAAPRTGAT